MGGEGIGLSASDCDFDYRPVRAAPTSPRGTDWIVATRSPPPLHLKLVLKTLPVVDAKPALDICPLHWTRVRFARDVECADIENALTENDVEYRYVCLATEGSQALGANAPFEHAEPVESVDWSVKDESRHHRSASGPGSWFFGPAGIELDRVICGTGAGTRLAVVDDDAGGAEAVGVEPLTVPAHLDVPLGSSHGSKMVGWAVGSRLAAGVAPDASPRLYCIPKPGADVVSLPAAVVRAVADGADVVVCATFTEGTFSPMWDDALEYARRLGRRGLGTAVVLPTGRQASSPAGAIHASWTLDFGDPAADPRVFCIGPSGRAGGWFSWTTRHGYRRPFANRGPNVRWLAPGDDITDPLRPSHLTHAESSGASAIAAGVILLVLGKNPRMSVNDIASVLTRTAVAIGRDSDLGEAMSFQADAKPHGRDADGHNAKCGYGRISASRACAAVVDPIASALATMGEMQVARRYLISRAQGLNKYYSDQLATRLAAAVVRSEEVRHASSAVLRHARLLAGHPERATHRRGALLRQIAICLRHVDQTSQTDSSAMSYAERAELRVLALAARTCLSSPEQTEAIEQAIVRAAGGIWEAPGANERLERFVAPNPCLDPTPLRLG